MDSENPEEQNKPPANVGAKQDESGGGESHESQTVNFLVRKENWWDKWKPRVEIVGTGALVVYTCFTFLMYCANNRAAKAATRAAGIAAKALRDNEKSFSETLKQMKAQTAAQEEAAAATQNAAGTAQSGLRTNAKSVRQEREQFVLAQRAWLGVDSFHTTASSEKTGVVAAMTFLNSGKTPARNVQEAAMYMTSPTPLLGPSSSLIAQLKFAAAQAVPPQGHFTMSLGTAILSRAGTTLSQIIGQKELISQFANIKAGEVYLYYFGEIKYKDLAGDSHYTQFCISLADPKTGELAYCDQFNDLD